MSNDKPLWQLTVGEFLSLLNEKKEENPVVATDYLYSIEALAKLLGCSKVRACQLKKEGLFDEAITQFGRTLIIDKNKVLEIIKNKNLCLSRKRISKK